MTEGTPTSSAENAIHLNFANPSLFLIPGCAATFGFVSGLLTSAERKSLQFLAENAHRQPTTLQGWYFYNKTKNYRVALAGLTGGVSTAIKLGAWTGSFVGLKELLTRSTGAPEAASGSVAGVCMALAACRLCKLVLLLFDAAARGTSHYLEATRLTDTGLS